MPRCIDCNFYSGQSDLLCAVNPLVSKNYGVVTCNDFEGTDFILYLKTPILNSDISAKELKDIYNIAVLSAERDGYENFKNLVLKTLSHPNMPEKIREYEVQQSVRELIKMTYTFTVTPGIPSKIIPYNLVRSYYQDYDTKIIYPIAKLNAIFGNPKSSKMKLDEIWLATGVYDYACFFPKQNAIKNSLCFLKTLHLLKHTEKVIDAINLGFQSYLNEPGRDDSEVFVLYFNSIKEGLLNWSSREFYNLVTCYYAEN